MPRFDVALLDAVYAVVVAYFVLLNCFYLLTSLVAFRELRRYAQRLKVLDTEELIAEVGSRPSPSSRPPSTKRRPASRRPGPSSRSATRTTRSWW